MLFFSSECIAVISDKESKSNDVEYGGWGMRTSVVLVFVLCFKQVICCAREKNVRMIIA